MADKIITVDKFLGLNESVDGSTELKPGEAAALENFLITDGYNMRSRSGIARYKALDPAIKNCTKAFPIMEKEKLWLCCEGNDGAGFTYIRFFHGQEQRVFRFTGVVMSTVTSDGKIVVIWENTCKTDNPDNGIPASWFIVCTYLDIEAGEEEHTQPYFPLLQTESAPSGGGTAVEPLNILVSNFRVRYNADGTNVYKLPPITYGVVSCTVNGTKHTIEESRFNAADTTYTFFTAPAAGTEVEFVLNTADIDLMRARNRLLQMPYCERFNGATDTRIFFYGDGSNITYYTGVPAHGTGLYIPAGNELAVDFSDSPITGLIRHYSRLLAFKPDGVESITYEPVTLADGSVIAGFYLRPVSRAFGNDAMGQLSLVNNSPRSFTGKSIYEWRVSNSGYRDERYAKCISQKVEKTLEAADMSKVIACDDDASKTYYVFLNDGAGTVLVNRYDLECWTVFRSLLTEGVTQAFAFEGNLMFLRGGELFTFDETALYDAPETEIGDPVPIRAHYESGFLSFGADYKRKYSSRLWLALLPQSASQLDITVKTDKRSEYLTKTVGYSLLDFSTLDFSNFSFETYSAPKVKRVQLKVKKFVYYKLILDVNKPGARATVLGYDQQLRLSSNAK